MIIQNQFFENSKNRHKLSTGLPLALHSEENYYTRCLTFNTVSKLNTLTNSGKNIEFENIEVRLKDIPNNMRTLIHKNRVAVLEVNHTTTVDLIVRVVKHTVHPV